jgi:tripartite ATP-independent transporter DctM subunit
MIGLLFITMLAFILLGVPVSFAIGLSSVFAIVFGGINVPLSLVAHRIFVGMDSFPLMCIPFFIITGQFMGAGNISQKLIDMANVFVGRIRGGLAHVNIMASMFFGGVSGSATADVTSIGSILIPTMEDAGYERDFSVAVTATSATIGIIIPPSNAMIIYATLAAGVSISDMFLAGIIPGILVGISLMVVAYVISLKRGYTRGEKTTGKGNLVVLAKGMVPLFTFVIILGGILGGIFTPTESAVVAAFYSFILATFVYKTVKFNEIPKILLKSALLTASVLLLIGISSIFGWLLAYAHIPESLAALLFSITDNRIILLLLIFVMLLIVGTFMDLTPALIIFVPIFLPIVQQLGMGAIQFGLFIIVSLAIGLYTPPVGSVLFVTCAISHLEMEKAVKAILPFMFAMMVIAILIVFVPSLTLWLPALING